MNENTSTIETKAPAAEPLTPVELRLAKLACTLATDELRRRKTPHNHPDRRTGRALRAAAGAGRMRSHECENCGCRIPAEEICHCERGESCPDESYGLEDDE